MNAAEIVATTAEPAFAVDRCGCIVAWNDAAELSLGYQRGEALGRLCWELLEGRDLAANRYCSEHCPLRDMARRCEAIHRTPMLFRHASGRTTRVAMSTLVVRGGDGTEIVHLLERAADGPEKRVLSRQTTHPGGAARLTPRQLEVLRQLAEGRSTSEIGEILFISPATVRHHIQHIFARLKVHSRLEAVTLAQRIGLLE